jgi:hypothetical protein
MEHGFIYSVRCKLTGKCYVGQAKEFKTKKGKPFRYGIQGRWSDHVSSAKCGRSTTPLAEAILQYGAEAFEINEIAKATAEELDALEAKWIGELGTRVPNGYNVCAHSHNHYMNRTSMVGYYTGRVESAVLRPTRKDGEFAIMYVMLTFKDPGVEVERMVFGQKAGGTFEEAREDALAFVRGIGCPFVEETSNSLDPLERYASKLKQFESKVIRRVRITTASSLVAVYVTTADAKTYKDQVRICFGGKVVPLDVAYELAKEFVNALCKNETTILEDHIRGPQQVAASKAETEP